MWPSVRIGGSEPAEASRPDEFELGVGRWMRHLRISHGRDDVVVGSWRPRRSVLGRPVKRRQAPEIDRAWFVVQYLAQLPVHLFADGRIGLYRGVVDKGL